MALFKFAHCTAGLSFLPALQKLDKDLGDRATKAAELDKNVGHLISWQSRWDILEIGGHKWNTAHNPPAIEKKDPGAFRGGNN